MNRRYEASELMGMTARRLQDVATEAGIKKPFNKNHTTPVRAERILRQYAKLDAAAAVHPDEVDYAIHPASPDFEAAVHDAVPTSSPVGSAPTSSRGGVREGAGRPLGMTDERSRATHVSQVPHPVIQSAFEALFASWAVAVGCDKVALTKDEAMDIALPWTQACDYLGWSDYIPEWATIFVAAGWNLFNVVKLKARFAREYRAEQKKAVGEQDLAAGGKSE